jgi:hypothetical protein
VPSRHQVLTPHNTFIWFAVSAGILPLALFIGWWIRMARAALSKQAQIDGVFWLPLLVHALIVSISGDLGFMQPWAILVLCGTMSRPARQTLQRRSAQRMPWSRPPGFAGLPRPRTGPVLG